MHINNLVVEVTRKCNMTCDHCLRGCAENLDISLNDINSLLSQVEYVGGVTFTGGEPSLNVAAINHFLNTCKDRNISIGSFYIATNGLQVSEDFVVACLRLYAYCDEKESCSVDVSNDMYHANCGGYNTELLDGLSFFHRKFEKEGYDYQKGKSIILEGNANNFRGGQTRDFNKIETIEDLNDTEVYLNVHGQIINGCDWSYDSQDTNEELHLCSVDNLKDFINSLEEE